MKTGHRSLSAFHVSGPGSFCAPESGTRLVSLLQFSPEEAGSHRPNNKSASEAAPSQERIWEGPNL